jgi:hypothetical protein
MESIKSITKQFAVLNKDYQIQSPTGEFKVYNKGDDFLLGGRYGYQYDLTNRGVIVPLAENVTHIIPEECFSFEEETEVIQITRTRVSVGAP